MQFVSTLFDIVIYIYIFGHGFPPSQDSSVWLRLMSREQLMSPECSKHQVQSFAKILVMLWTNKKYCYYIYIIYIYIYYIYKKTLVLDIQSLYIIYIYIYITYIYIYKHYSRLFLVYVCHIEISLELINILL